MYIGIRQQPFDPWREIAGYQDRVLRPGAFGATAVFVGTMRDFNEGDAVEAMTLEHYPEMTQAFLNELVEGIIHRYGLDDAIVLHRVGSIAPGDPIVLVAVWSAHRAAAFDACRAVMEELKSHAPFWKKETLTDGARWVERNTPGTSLDDAADTGDETMDEQTRADVEAAVFRRLVEHLRANPEVQNIDLMNLAGFCRNCLSKWYRAAAEERGHTMDYEQARETVYGMPYAEFKKQHQREASPEQAKAFEQAQRRAGE